MFWFSFHSLVFWSLFPLLRFLVPLPTPLCYDPLPTLTFSGPPSHSLVLWSPSHSYVSGPPSHSYISGPPSHSLVYTGDSDDEVEESVSVAFPDAILEPKDPYSLRPLPLRIGTAEFLGQDDVGLVDYASDTEGMCSKRCTLTICACTLTPMCMYTKRYHTCMYTNPYVHVH